jgi:membrane-associated phospholipid phosphatase
MIPENGKWFEITRRDRTRDRSGDAVRWGVVWPATLLLVVSLLLCYPKSAGFAAVSSASPLSAIQDVVVEIDNGLLTATFSDQTDDAALAAALPGLIGRGVESINLRGAPIRELRPISRFTGLKELNLSGTQVRDLGPLAGMANLRSLNLQFLRVSDLRPLAGLASLQTLNLGGTDIRDLAPLAGLVRLKTLVIAVTKIKDLTALTALRQLISLDLGSTWVSNLRPLAGMTSLRSLSLNGAPVEDLQPLARMMSLVALDLGGTQVSDVRALSDLRELLTLNLESTQVADVTPLARLPALKSVALGGSLVHDMTPLARLAAANAARPQRQAIDPVLFWNDQTNRSIQATGTDPFRASRVLALESIAVLDTLKSIDGTPAFFVRLPAPRDISAAVAAAAAAHAMLVHLFPTRQAALDAAFHYTLANETDGPQRVRAVAFGEAMAAATIARREDDGADAGGGSRADIPAGRWRPGSPEPRAGLDQQWARLKPFGMTAPDQFRPPGPPAADSAAFKEEKAQVMALGGLHSGARTPEQTEIARYWSDSIGTYAPAGHWNAIAATIVEPLRLGVTVEAELFAELNIAMADAGIAMADAKYTYWMPRPVTAIRAGGSGEAPVPDWAPLLDTPSHPSYISGHASFSGAAATVMTAWFGNRPFAFSSASLQGVIRNFISFDQAAEEAAASRVYGGIHFASDNTDGLATGRAVGAWTMGVFQRMSEDRGPFLMVGGQVGMAGKGPRSIEGCALDNLSPVAAITARLDGGAPFTVSVDEQGLFVVPRRQLPPGRHEVVLAATSSSGRTSTVRVAVE